MSSRTILASTYIQGDILYTLPNITAGVNHTVRLYFYDNGYSTVPGDVVFDIYINDVLRISNFDLIAEAGGAHNGFWRDIPNILASNGSIIVDIVPKLTWNQTWNDWLYNATISGIKVTAN